MSARRTFFVIKMPAGYQPPYLADSVHGGWAPEYAKRFSLEDATVEAAYRNHKATGHAIRMVTVKESDPGSDKIAGAK